MPYSTTRSYFGQLFNSQDITYWSAPARNVRLIYRGLGHQLKNAKALMDELNG